MPNLSNMLKYLEGIATTAAGTSTINGAVFDMSAFEGILFIIKFGTAAADNQIKAQEDTVLGFGGAADLAGTLTGNGASDGIVWLDIYRPLKQFIRMVALRGTSTTIDWGIAIRYGGKKGPQSNILAATIFGELHISPDPGTA